VDFVKKKWHIDLTLDIKGLSCPRPTVMAINTIRNMDKGRVLQVITDDRQAKESISMLCLRSGYRIIDIKENDGLIYMLIQK